MAIPMKTHLIKFTVRSIKHLRGIVGGLIAILLFFNVLPKLWSQALPPLFWADDSSPTTAGSGTWTTSTSSGSLSWSSSSSSTFPDSPWVQGRVAHFVSIISGGGTVTLGGTFSASGSDNITAAGINFDAGASSFTIDTHGNTLTINGPGIVNTSGTTQTISNNGTELITSGPLVAPGSTSFLNTWTADNAT